MPSSVMVGSRPPRSCLIFSYSSGVRPCSRTISGVMARVVTVVMRRYYCRIWNGRRKGVSSFPLSGAMSRQFQPSKAVGNLMRSKFQQERTVAMPTRNVNLTAELDRFVATKVKSGRYENASEVVRAGLRTLEREEQQYEAKLAALRAAIDEGDASGIAEGNVFGRVRKALKLPVLPR